MLPLSMDLSERPKTPETQKTKSGDTSPAKPTGNKTTDWPAGIISTYLMQECIAQIKVDESQKSILWECPEGENILKHLEDFPLEFRYCRLCEECNDESHFTSKVHIKKREELGIKELEDQSLSQLVFESTPGDITAEL
jgi:translation initiation factor 2 beta subunit (eIF-2beta)/eIF-5